MIQVQRRVLHAMIIRHGHSDSMTVNVSDNIHAPSTQCLNDRLAIFVFELIKFYLGRIKSYICAVSELINYPA